MNYLKQYFEAIENGEEIVGEELYNGLKNLVIDPYLNSDKYYIDNSVVEYRINFIERYIKHTKSPFHGKPFILELWQKAFIEAVYGYKNCKTHRRRFKKVILLIARKNGKSTLCAALAICDLLLSPGGTEICISSNDDSQADIIFQEIKNMISLSKPLRKRIHINLKGIYNRKNLSRIFKMSDKTKNKEGRNIDVGILDESHEMKTNVIAKSIEQSQSTKDEPLFINITTEGFVDDGYLDSELKYSRKVIELVEDDETLLPWLYTMDSEQEIFDDPESWKKANPSLGTIKKYSYIEGELRKARFSTKDRVFTLSKDFNIKQNNAASWLLESDIINQEKFNIEDFMNCYGFGALDLAETNDLCSAKIMLIRPSDKKKCILSMYFIPEAKCDINSPTNPEKVDYLNYAKQNLIRISEGWENDFDKVAEWFYELYKKYGIRVYKGGYDKWHSKTAMTSIENIFGSGIWENITQGFNEFSNPMSMLETDLKNKQVIYNDNPLDKMCLKNTAVEVNKYGQQRPIKSGQSKRIDGSVTMLMLYNLYEKYKNDLYSLNGMR